MKNKLLVSGILMVGLVNLSPLALRAASALELEVDTAHSSIGFDIKHLVVSTVHGDFTEFSGVIDFDEKNLAASKVNFTVKTDSVSTNNAKRDTHLKSADFFDVQKFPEATFVSTSIKAKGKEHGNDEYVLEGNLTIHGVTKKAQLNLISLGKVKDPYGVEKRMFQASTEIVRKDYGLTYNAALESGGVLIGDTAKLTIDLETAPKAVKKASAQ